MMIKKADIPAATQLFTTDWVVRYMVDNSLGRYWIERNPQSKLAEKLEFFVTPKNGEIQYVDEKISPTDLTFFDKTTPRLIQFHTFKNAANPPFLGGFSIFSIVAA